MPKKEKYRLEPLITLKLRAKRLSEIALAKAIRELQLEKEKLAKLKQLKKELHQKREKARFEMREKIASGQSRIRESQVHLNFLDKLKEDEEKLDLEIKEQNEELEKAEQKLKRARRDYIDAAGELNIMEKHKELWQKKQGRILSALESKQMNELGSTVYQLNRMRAG